MLRVRDLGRRLVRPIGTLVSILALAAFLYTLMNVLPEGKVRRVFAEQKGALLLALVFYGFCCALMVRAWIVLVHAGGNQYNSAILSRIFLISQIGKYLPGNVAHFMGRAYLAKSNGIPLATSGLAMGLELIGVLVSGAILAAVAVGIGAMSSQGDLVWLITGGAVVLAATGAVFVAKVRKVRLAHMAVPFAISIGFYLLVLTIMAAANIVIIGSLSGDWSLEMIAKVGGAFIVSWLIGFVTPGSPAGFGLREVGFYSLLASHYADETVLLTAAGFRIVTVTGDLLAWLVGILWGMRPSLLQRARPN